MNDNIYKKIRIFVAHTSETEKEKSSVFKICEVLNKSIAESKKLLLDPIDWKSGASPAMGRPQSVILEQIPVKSWDVFIGVLWKRFGTPTGAKSKSDDKYYESGTEEEFKNAYKTWLENNKPKILFFRCNKQVPPDQIDTDQLNKLNMFFKEFQFDGKNPGIYFTYQEESEFETYVTKSLLSIISKTELSNGGSKDDMLLTPTARDAGFMSFFTQSENDRRNKEKIDAIGTETKKIRLIAHTGHSYLSLLGGKFRDKVYNSLENKVKWEVIILNPWTYTGLSIAFAEKDQAIDTNADYYDVISNSTYYKYSLQQCIEGYRDLKDNFSDFIELKISKNAISSTNLITTNQAFFEPYVSINLRDRLNKTINTFEIEISSNCYFYNTVSNQFEDIWIRSYAIDEYLNTEEFWKNKFKELIKDQT